jgi:hypothetical protein
VLGIIKSKDQYDIIRIQKTSDTGKNKTTGAIIEKLKNWDRLCPFEIAGADTYWMKARFIKKPPDMKQFALEITDFCPELLDDGTGKIEDIIDTMQRENAFYLLF